MSEDQSRETHESIGQRERQPSCFRAWEAQITRAGHDALTITELWQPAFLAAARP